MDGNTTPIHVFPVLCDVCRRNEKNVKADGYCETCRECMCMSCIETHENQSDTKHHHVTRTGEKQPDTNNHQVAKTSEKQSDIQNYQMAKTSKKQPDTKHHHATRISEDTHEYSELSVDMEDTRAFDMCDEHANEPIKFFCLSHDFLGCGECVVEKHRTCKVEHISDLARKYKNGKSFRDLISSLDKLEKDVEKNTASVSKSYNVLDFNIRTEVQKIEQFRLEINNYLDQRQEVLLGQLRESELRHKELLEELRERCEQIQTSVRDIKAKLNIVGSDTHLHFIVSKLAEMKLKHLLVQKEKVARIKDAPKFTFTVDKETEKVITSDTLIGVLEFEQLTTQEYLTEGMTVKKALTTLRFAKEPGLSCKSPEDNGFCYITGLTLTSRGHLLLADFQTGHKSVKLVNTSTNTIESRLVLTGCPYEIKSMPNDQAVVTIPHQGLLQFLDVRGNRILKGRAIKVDGKCYGVAHYRNKLIVSSHCPSKVEILTLRGQVISRVEYSGNGLPMFKYPNHIAVGFDGETDVIYVTDRGQETVTKLDTSGRIISVSRDKGISLPYGITAIGQGAFFCSYGNNGIQACDNTRGQGTKDETVAMTTILKTKDGIRHPMCLCFDEEREMIYISSYHGKRSANMNNELQVFKII
ncbi:hypothetical protein MAR_001951 [Mya arenaria]|uniref:B box-type domain-containing protein n=1 Tax=Mya arenaria TaxID=6604 RepID=A0ABY7FD70_MYAAR|nr:uncharacterized protein LOC128209802 [Mya arenaria]WAR20113.1 hypothetical protein MAR_001951 [Mya arenaria]